jgi:single-stranded DNA-binding protein
VSIDCAFFGFLASDAEARTSQAGKQWVRLRVGVGKDDAVQWVSVAVFGKAAEIAAELKKADRVYCEGAIKLDSWRSNDGTERHSLAVTSFKIEKTHQIGRNRPRKQERSTSGRNGSSDYSPIGDSRANAGGHGVPNDDVPFAPEIR